MTREQAGLCQENLFAFLDFVSYCYGTEYIERKYNRVLLSKLEQPVIVDAAKLKGQSPELVMHDKLSMQLNFKALMAENASLKAQLTARREEEQQTYVQRPLELTEYKTRKLYIDDMLQRVGWVEGGNWINELLIPGMPNRSQEGFADYVLYGDDHRPLAVIKAKRTCVDVSKGRQQAKLYANLLEKEHGRRPVIFLTNGFETRIDDGQYPERRVATIYSKRDLEKLFNLRGMKTSLKNIAVDRGIAGRYYQEGAIKAVCDSFGTRNRRKALLVMATGSGKTRTVIALCKVLLDYGWVKNILFLAK